MNIKTTIFLVLCLIGSSVQACKICTMKFELFAQLTDLHPKNRDYEIAQVLFNEAGAELLHLIGTASDGMVVPLFIDTIGGVNFWADPITGTVGMDKPQPMEITKAVRAHLDFNHPLIALTLAPFQLNQLEILMTKECFCRHILSAGQIALASVSSEEQIALIIKTLVSKATDQADAKTAK